MRATDVLGLAAESLRLHRLRTSLSGLAIAIGATAVLVLTGAGEAARRYVVDRFAAMGAHVVMITPGRVETSGMPAPNAGTDRELTLEDAEILWRVPGARRVVPVSIGTAPFRHGERRRDVFVLGTTADYAPIRELEVRRGRFLPSGDARDGGSIVVIGTKLAREVFGNDEPVGQMARIGTRRFRVVGVLAPKGQMPGADFDDLAIVPVATGLALFDQSGLRQILVQTADATEIARVSARVRAELTRRHRGEDFTMLTQDAMLRGLRAILDAVTAAVAGIAAISLAVAGIGIMNVMLIAVSERVAEIGLLKALGARRRQVAGLFLAEALLLSAAGALLGVGGGLAALAIGARLWPDFPLAPSARWIACVVALSLVCGGVFGILPARRAAALPAAEALRARR